MAERVTPDAGMAPAGCRLLRSEDRIGRDVDTIAAAIRKAAAGRVPVFIGLLKGSFVFLADLIRAYGAPHEIEFLSVTRYDPTRKDPSSVRVLHDLTTNIGGRFVVLVEGIRSRGTKIVYVDRFLRLHNPQEIYYCALVAQQGAAASEVPLHSWGFEIDPEEYVLGYGLDVGERYRNLPFIAVSGEGFATGDTARGQSIESNDRVESSEPVGSNERVESNEPIGSGESSASTERIEPIDPIQRGGRDG